MPKFRIPVQDGRSIGSASPQLDPADRFGKKIERVVNPIKPTADAFGAQEAQALTNASRVVDKVGNDVSNIIDREERLRQSEENNKAKLAFTELAQEKQTAENELKTQAYVKDWGADFFQEKLKERVDDKSQELSSQEYNTYIGDRFRDQLKQKVEGYSIEWKSAGSIVEQYRVDRILKTTNETINTMRQVSAASGEYSVVMDNVNQLETILKDPVNVIAMGGDAKVDVALLNAKNEFYVDHIKLEIQRDPSQAMRLLDTKMIGKDKEFEFYKDLNPQKRRDLFVLAGNALNKKLKDKKEAREISMSLEHARNNPNTIKPNDPKYKKKVNERFLLEQDQVKHLPTNERYAVYRDFVKDYQVLPDNLKQEVINTFKSGISEEKKKVLKFANNLIDEHPFVVKQLPEAMIQAATLYRSGSSLEHIVEMDKQVLHQPVAVRDTLKIRWKSEKGNEYIEGSYSSVSKDIAQTGFFSSTPEISNEFKGQLGVQIKTNFMANGGNLDAAKAQALIAMSKTWGVTNIGGKRMMQYAPEVLHASGDESPWMNTQLKEEVFAYDNTTLEDDKYRLIPTQSTRMGQSKDYHVLVQNENGLFIPLSKGNGEPLRWQPDYTKTPEWREQRYEMNVQATQDRENLINKQVQKSWEISLKEKMSEENVLEVGRKTRAFNEQIDEISNTKGMSKKIKMETISRIKEQIKDLKKIPTKPNKIKLQYNEETAEFIGVPFVEKPEEEKEINPWPEYK